MVRDYETSYMYSRPLFWFYFLKTLLVILGFKTNQDKQQLHSNIILSKLLLVWSSTFNLLFFMFIFSQLLSQGYITISPFRYYWSFYFEGVAAVGNRKCTVSLFSTLQTEEQGLSVFHI